MKRKLEIKYLKRAIYILNKIYELSGYEAYLVGGAVRDFLLNRRTSDFDVAINVKSLIVFKDRFFQEELKFLRYEKYYKSIKFIDKKTGLKFEFTPMRKEFYGKICEPRIVFTDQPEVDSRRRDFKINAIYMDRNKRILDFTNGISDLKNRRISFIGSPGKRILEDPKRIIRALKFSELLSFKFQKETYSEIFKYFYLIKNISDDYKYKELKTIILRQNDLVFNLLCEIGFISKRTYEQEFKREYNFIKTYLEKYNIKYDVFISILIIKLEIEEIESFFKFIGFRNKQILNIKEIIKIYNSSEDYLEVCAYILNKYGADLLFDFYDVYNFIRIVWGVSSAEGEKIDKIAKIIHNIKRGLIPNSIREVNINGEDLMKIGIKGALIGKTLDEIFKLTLVGENNQRENLLRVADIIYKKSGGNMKKYFGTDGARGIANKELTNEFLYKTGRAIVKYLKKDRPTVVVGMDTRISSKMLQMSLMSGIIAEGGIVYDLGIVPTPAVAYIARKNNADIAVMISASHNPYEYNGVKLIGGDGYKLSDETEEEIESIIDTIENDEKSYDEIGEYRDGTDFKEDYVKHILDIPKHSLRGLKVGIDSGDGVMSYFAERIFKELGCEVKKIFSNGDGRHINENSGSTCPKKVAELVLKEKLDFGVSFDGDADRVIFSDEKGNVLDGDHIIAYSARNYLEHDNLTNDGVVTTTMSNMAFEEYLKENNIKLERADVGDRYVMEGMRKHGYVIGGEKSGHIIFLDHNTMGDGVQTAVIVADMLASKNQKASVIGEAYTDYPQVLVNANADDHLKKTFRENKNISLAIEKMHERHPNYRVLIRPSGTEKYVRIMLEGTDLEELKIEADTLKDVIEKEA